jgi:uncharacterized membrane protein
MNDPTPTPIPLPSLASPKTPPEASPTSPSSPAIIFLVTAPYNKSSYIRFHSWQCLFMALAWFVIDVAVMIFGSFLSFFRLLTFGLYPLISLAMLILWIMVLIKAFNGERFKLPIIGDLAAKQAGQ